MIYLSLRRWSNAFQEEVVIRNIRQVILLQVERGECVLVMEDGALGLTDEVHAQLKRDWPSEKVRFSIPVPQIKEK